MDEESNAAALAGWEEQVAEALKADAKLHSSVLVEQPYELELDGAQSAEESVALDLAVY